MKIAISNIAWQKDEEKTIAALLQKFGITGVEIAPGKISPAPVDAKENEILAYKNFWADYGIKTVALQALLFGRPDLTIFESLNKRAETLEYLKKIIKLGSILGAKILVFGSPKNRIKGDLSLAAANEIAASFFYDLGVEASQYGMKFCIEPNPSNYGGDYILNSDEAYSLVKAVSHPGFGLHLDSGGMILSQESANKILEYGDDICHFHISQPFLESLTMDQYLDKHEEFAEALKKIKYGNYISIEMKALSNTESNSNTVQQALNMAQKTYYDFKFYEEVSG